MATGFQLNLAKRPTHVNTQLPRYASVAEYMDTVNSVNILYKSYSTNFWPRQDLKIFFYAGFFFFPRRVYCAVDIQ